MHRVLTCLLLLECGQVAELHAQSTSFPPLPAETERRAGSIAESAAGAVVLESAHEITGHLTWEKERAHGEVVREHRYRYLVLTAKGAERLGRYSFLRAAAGTMADIQGRTVTGDGNIHPIDPVRDVQVLDLGPDADDKARQIRTVIFPRLEPGSILDLAWTDRSAGVPGFEQLQLQEDLPVRYARVKVRGQLQQGKAVVIPTPLFYSSFRPGYYWIPFFIGPAPPNATVKIDGAFNLELQVRDLASVADEPLSPPQYRTSCTLGLMPKQFRAKKNISHKDWMNNLLVFGTPEADQLDGEEEALSKAIDPANTLVQLDASGFQSVPGERWTDLGLLGDIQDNLKDIDNTYASRWKLKSGEEFVAPIAPADLPWDERARRLFAYVREQITVTESGPRREDLDELRKMRKGTVLDISRYYARLVESAGMRARLVLALSRYSWPFHPIAGQVRPYGPFWLVQVTPAEGTQTYVMPGNKYGDFDAVPAPYQGAVAFLQPVKPGDDWVVTTLPANLWTRDLVGIASRAFYKPGARELDLSIKTRLAGAMASSFRADLEPPEQQPQSQAESQAKVIEGWVRRWTGARWTGKAADVGLKSEARDPLAFEVTARWRPDSQPRQDLLMLPALPSIEPFRCPFKAEARTHPMWLHAGRSTFGHSWLLPIGTGLVDVPAPVERIGPAGLAFRIEIAPDPPSGTNVYPGFTTRLSLDVPAAIPASEYAAVKRFYEDLEAAAGAHVGVMLAEKPLPGGH